MTLTIVGSGDAFGSGGRFQSCYHVEMGTASFLLDCGATALTALKRAGLSGNAIDTIVISHLHGDHFGGLPFILIDALYPARRRTPLTLVGPPGLEARFWIAAETLFPRSTQAPRAFDLAFMELEPGIRREIAGFVVTPYPVEHYSGSPSYALRFEAGGKVFAFSGDSGWTEALIEAGRGADLYLMECYQYDLRLAMHLDYLTIAAHFDAIDARQLVLTHMSEAMLAHAGDVDRRRCRLAEDGMVITF